jgi:hypothetical protein
MVFKISPPEPQTDLQKPNIEPIDVDWHNKLIVL